MPQEKRRTISYRSFVTCDNPKGVECGAIRKSKSTCSEKKEQHSHRLESEKRQQNKTPSLEIVKEEKKEMGIREFTRELEKSSFQLQERPKNLNHVTNSWPNSNNGDKQDIAKDLLKGVLDLRESLAILSKLQEISSYNSSNRMQKQKQKLEEVRFDDMGKGLMDSNRFGYVHDEEKLYVGFERSRFSVDGSSRKSFDEVKSVVRESLLRQNVIRKFDSPHLPCTSSSNFARSDSSVSSSHRRNKGISSNLIVKLMGLESLPSSPRNHKGVEKVVNVTKPMSMYDIESPRGIKPKFSTQELGTKQRAFDEILESFNFKGLLRSNSPTFEDFLPVDERPPIVVMRPMRFWGDFDSENEENLMKLSSSRRRGLPQETVRNAKANFRGMSAREQSYELTKKPVYADEKLYINQCDKPHKKKATVRRVSEEEKVTLTGWKGEEKRETHIIEGLGFRDMGKFTRTKMKRDKDGDFFSKTQTSCPIKANFNANLDYRIVKTSESSNHQKKSRKPVSMMQVVRKENEASAREEIDSTRENEFAFPTFDSMLMSKLNIERWNKHSRVMIADYDADNQSSISDTGEGIKYLNNDPKKSHHIANMDMHDDNLSLLSEITSTSISENCSFGGHLDENQSSVSEITSVTTNEEENADHQKMYHPFEDSMEEEIHNELSRNCHTQRAKLKAFFLSSPSFVTRIEDLFNLQVNPGLVPQLTVVDSDNPRVLLDCASELMELRRSQLSQVCLNPCLQTMYPQYPPSLSQLLEEVCKGIEDLRCYLNPGIESFSSDQLYDLLDRDLMFKSVTWEIGWRNEFSWDEVEQVVGEVDKFVLANLIEEVLEDFVQ